MIYEFSSPQVEPCPLAGPNISKHIAASPPLFWLPAPPPFLFSLTVGPNGSWSFPCCWPGLAGLLPQPDLPDATWPTSMPYWCLDSACSMIWAFHFVIAPRTLPCMCDNKLIHPSICATLLCCCDTWNGGCRTPELDRGLCLWFGQHVHGRSKRTHLKVHPVIITFSNLCHLGSTLSQYTVSPLLSNYTSPPHSTLYMVFC